MLAAGRRDILVPASGLSAARDVLMQADLLGSQAGPAVERPARLLGVLLGVVVFVGVIAWMGTEDPGYLADARSAGSATPTSRSPPSPWARG